MPKASQLVTAAALALIAFLGAVPAARAVDEGEKAPDFTLPAIDGGASLKLADFRGKVVLVDFWATWCAPCIQALPEIQELSRRMAGKPFTILGVNTDADDSRLKFFLSRHPAEGWPQVRDRTSRTAKEIYRVRGYPTYLVLDPQGRVVRKVEGWDPGTIPQKVTPAVEGALKAMAGGVSKRAAASGHASHAGDTSIPGHVNPGVETSARP